MKKQFKSIQVLFVICLFALFALGSGSSSDEKKEIADGDTPSQTETTTEKKEDVSIEEQVVLDSNGIVVTAKSIEHDSIFGEELTLLIENNSDKDILVGADEVIVNNYMITDFFSETVAAGKKSNTSISLFSSELEDAGITNIGQIEIYFTLSDPSTYHTMEEDYACIQTSGFSTMDTTPNDSGKELYNANGIRIVGKYVDENTIWGTGVLLYIENNSGQNIMVSCDDLSINGFMVNAYFASTVYNEKMAINDITIFKSDLEENKIESVQDIELKFRISNNDTYATIAETDPIQFSVTE